jgi:hypothetical protein
MVDLLRKLALCREMSNTRQEERRYSDRFLLARYQKEKTPAKEMARVGAAFMEIAQHAE